MCAEPGLGLYLMTAKGEAVLSKLLVDHGPGRIHHIVVARDPATEYDGYETILALAREAGIPAHDRLKLPSDLKVPRYLFAVSWRWLITPAPSQELVVLHDSLLPRYRGFAPLVSALVNGDTEIGVTALFAAEEYDRGPIIAQRSVQVRYPITIAEAIIAVAHCYAQLASEVVTNLLAGEAKGRLQDESMATYSLWRDDQDYEVDWSWDAERIRRFVDAVGSPYRGALVYVEGRPCRILACEVLPDVTVENRTPGKTIFLREGKPVVVCGRGLLWIRRLVEDSTGTELLPLRKFRVRFADAPKPSG